jgi:hypothetical protein
MTTTRAPLTTTPLAEQATRYVALLAEVQRASKRIAVEFEKRGWPTLAFESSFLGADAADLSVKIGRFAREAAS